MKTKKIKVTGWNSQEAMMFGFVAGAVIISLLLTGLNLYKNQQFDKYNICVPKTHAGVYVNINSNYAVAVLDLQDQTQKQITLQLQQFFKAYSQQLKGGTK